MIPAPWAHAPAAEFHNEQAAFKYIPLYLNIQMDIFFSLIEAVITSLTGKSLLYPLDVILVLHLENLKSSRAPQQVLVRRGGVNAVSGGASYS